jgi:hypothetical protein
MHVCMMHTMRGEDMLPVVIGQVLSTQSRRHRLHPREHHPSFLSRSFNYDLVDYGHEQRSRSDSAVGFRATSFH